MHKYTHKYSYIVNIYSPKSNGNPSILPSRNIAILFIEIHIFNTSITLGRELEFGDARATVATVCGIAH